MTLAVVGPAAVGAAVVTVIGIPPIKDLRC